MRAQWRTFVGGKKAHVDAWVDAWVHAWVDAWMDAWARVSCFRSDYHGSNRSVCVLQRIKPTQVGVALLSLSTLDRSSRNGLWLAVT